MTAKAKNTAAQATENAEDIGKPPMAERIDMNDPTLTDEEAVARNLGLTETAPADAA